ncbi:hypothetical protein YTPLAS21_21380 [Candidatus Nitrosocosmicus sp.]|nr:hypothetical protein YTPLAS21_21380 [Candidatus Nitrosocosmicus sp.]
MDQNSDQKVSSVVWEILDEPAERVSQGDLFYFEDEISERRYGIVVTADCDLTNKKHSRLISLVPLLCLEDLLINCLYIDHLEKIRNQIADLLHDTLHLEVPVNDPAFEATLAATLKGNVKIPEEILTTAEVFLQRTDSITSKNFQALLRRLPNSLKNTYSRFEQQIKSRGDIIVLTCPPYTVHDVRLVWLRRVWQVKLGDLALRTSFYMPNRNLGQHVARLASPFRYRLTQQLAQVFSDIGTPDLNNEWIDKAFKEKLQ